MEGLRSPYIYLNTAAAAMCPLMYSCVHRPPCCHDNNHSKQKACCSRCRCLRRACMMEHDGCSVLCCVRVGFNPTDDSGDKNIIPGIKYAIQECIPWNWGLRFALLATINNMCIMRICLFVCFSWGAFPLCTRVAGVSPLTMYSIWRWLHVGTTTRTTTTSSTSNYCCRAGSVDAWRLYPSTSMPSKSVSPCDNCSSSSSRVC